MRLATREIKCRNSGVGDASLSSRRFSFKATVEVVLAINQIVIWNWYPSWIIGVRSLLRCHNTFRGIVIPIRLRNMSAPHKMASIASILPKSQDRGRYHRWPLVARTARYCWRLGSSSVWKESETYHHCLKRLSEPMNDHRSEESIRILCAIMRMIPAGPVRIGEETVREIRSRSDRALAHRRNAIEPRAHGTPLSTCVRFLQHTMPVDGCALFMQDGVLLFGSWFDVIVNINLKDISPIS